MTPDEAYSLVREAARDAIKGEPGIEASVENRGDTIRVALEGGMAEAACWFRPAELDAMPLPDRYVRQTLRAAMLSLSGTRQRSVA